jgi:F420-dependent oxidoreductase-like protein
VEFGVHTGLQNTSIGELQSLWRRIEDHGFSWISIWDHFYAADGTGNPHCLEAVASHAALAATTSRVRCGSLVYSVGYRHPAILANTMATLDQLSDGRITLGLGAGWLVAEYEAYGIPFPDGPVRLRQEEEAIQCIRGLLTQDVTSFDGEFFSLTDAQCVPKPVQARLPLWIGGGGEKVTLRIAARHADGWNAAFISPEDYGHKAQVLERHCADADRDPATIQKTVNTPLAWDDAALSAQFGKITEFVRPSVLTGSTQEVLDKVGAYRDAGAEMLILAMRAPFDVDGLDRFAAEVLPQLA